MRRFLLLGLGAVLACAAAYAAYAPAAPVQRTPGAVGLSLRDGSGYAAVTRRGSLLLRVARGRVWVTDLPGGSKPSVNCDRRGRRVNDSTRLYRGSGLSCRVFGGPWRVRIRGRNIDADSVVLGSLTLDREGAKGRFSIDGGAYRRWPAARTSYRLG